MAVWPLSVYAAAHPDDVAGVVLVDPRGPHVSARMRAALPPPRPDEPEQVTLEREGLGAFERDPNLNPEHVQFTKAMAEASAVLDAPGPLFGDAPMRVLGAEYTYLSGTVCHRGSTKKFAGSGSMARSRWPRSRRTDPTRS